MPQVPEPNYDYQTDQLAALYQSAIRDILAELDRVDVSNFQRANATATLKSISEILSELNKESATWVKENVPKAAKDGIVNTLLSLEVAASVSEAQKIVAFNEVNDAMVAAAVADTQADLLAVTQNVDRKTRAAVRKAVSDSMRYNMARGTNGRQSITEDVRKALQNSVTTGIIDARGRRWKPEVYSEMVVRTKMMETYREANTNEAVGRGVYYAQISSHGATDLCRNHEGQIIKLTEDAPGNYPTYESLKATGEIFHPRCKHVFSPIRNP
ncbi:phage minor capsid protein [Bacillus subtilis]|uniref:phage minor capsid protein n=1 Tax=Bacillus subtilis TaxID=1423 RepID=UPI003981235F